MFICVKIVIMKTESESESEEFTGDTPTDGDILYEKVEVGNDQEKAQSERTSHSQNRGGKNLN